MSKSEPKPTIEQAKQYNAELITMTDPDKISSAVSQQVALVGSQSLYEKINSNFKEERFEAFFAKVELLNQIFLSHIS